MPDPRALFSGYGCVFQDVLRKKRRRVWPDHYLRPNLGAFFQDAAPFFQDVLNKNGAAPGGQLCSDRSGILFFRINAFQDILNKSCSYIGHP